MAENFRNYVQKPVCQQQKCCLCIQIAVLLGLHRVWDTRLLNILQQIFDIFTGNLPEITGKKNVKVNKWKKTGNIYYLL